MSVNEVFIVFFVGVVTGICSGKIHERVQWNKLIDRGIIPSPRKAK